MKCLISWKKAFIISLFAFDTGCQLQRDHSLTPADRSIEMSTRTECQKKLP